MRALATTDEQVAFWHSHTRQGIFLCLVVPFIIVVDVSLSPDPAHPLALYLISAFMVLVGVLVPLVPMEKVVRHKNGRLFFDAWDGTGIVLTGATSLLDGGISSPYTVFLYILLAHAAMAYPPVGTSIAGAAAIACYLVVGVATGASLPDLITGCLSLAAATITCALASWNHVRAHQKTRALAHRLAELADRDGLTGLLNHRAFHHRLAQEVTGAAQDRPLSVVLVDVDEFKSVNDTFGHPAGDAVLRLVAGVLSDASGTGDHAGRLGGDEFALVLPAAAQDEAVTLARGLCDQVRTVGADYGVTLSAGIATTSGTDVTALLAEADAAVYHAKHSGRDRASTVPSRWVETRVEDRRRPDGTGSAPSPAVAADLTV